MADFILYAEIDELKDEQRVITGYTRVLHTAPTTIYEAGNRTQFSLPDTLPLSYEDFTHALMMSGTVSTVKSNPETAPESEKEAKPKINSK
jgi:hypothetical protein